MDRGELAKMKHIHEIINERKPARYLEVGIFRCDTLFGVKSKLRVGVDPKPMIDLSVLTQRLYVDACNGERTLIFPMRSDNYFKNLYINDKFDVIFVDGFHEYEQALRDIENAMKVLDDKGVIFVHDVNPVGEAAMQTWYDGVDNGEWNGDVWRAMLELKERGVKFHTIDIPHGLSVIEKQEIGPSSDALRNHIKSLNYEHFNNNRKQILGLK